MLLRGRLRLLGSRPKFRVGRLTSYPSSSTMVSTSPSGTPLSKESYTLRKEAAAPLSSKTPAGESSRKESTEVPKDPLEDFSVHPAGTLFGNGSSTPSGSFPWIYDLGPMLDEIWSAESFKWFSEEPLQAGNREGMRMLSRVSSLMFASRIFKFNSNLLICYRHSSQILFTPEEQRPSLPNVRKPYFTFARRMKNWLPSSTKLPLKRISHTR